MPGTESHREGLQSAIAAHKAGLLTRAEQLYRQHLAAEPEAALALSNLGQILLARGESEAALVLFQRALAAQPRFAAVQAYRGNALMALGRLSEARAAFDQALATNRNAVEALAGLASLRQRQGDIWDSLSYWQRALAAAPQRNDVRQNLALVLADAGRLDEAVAEMDKAVQAEPHAPAGHVNRSTILRRAGRFSEAISAGERAIALAPENADAHYNLAMALIDHGDHEGGLAALNEALRQAPAHVDALNVMGLHHRRHDRPEEALACFRQAGDAQPRHLGILLNIGAVLLDMGRPEEAVATYRRALAIDGKKVEVLINLGVALEQLERFEEALEAYRLAISFEPENGDAHFNHAIALLTLGRFPEGWKEYEWRQRALIPVGLRKDLGPDRWDGAPPAGKRLFVHAEQGIGDTIQFARFLPQLRAAGAQVIFECQAPLRRLFGLTDLADSIVSRGDRLPEYDLYTPLLSLPHFLGTTAVTIPPAGYLHTDRAESEASERQLAGLHRPRIGIAWQGNPQHKADRRRSIPLAVLLPVLLPVLRPAKASLVSLQVGFGREQIATMPQGERPTDPFETEAAPDFATTAAVIENLDLVITIDSAVAHLAGAMNKPVWVMLSHVADWRWLRNREDSPWYPTMRLFRQPRPGDWSHVFARLSEALRRWR